MKPSLRSVGRRTAVARLESLALLGVAFASTLLANSLSFGAPPRDSAHPSEVPAPPSDAAATRAERAAALKAEGDAAMDSSRYADAFASYDEARQLSGDAALEYNTARALEMLGRFPEALEHLRSFQARATPDLLARVPKLAELLTDIEQHTTLLTVRVNVRGASVQLGDRILGKTPLDPLRINAAKSSIVAVSLEGFETESRAVALPGGGQASLDVELIPKDRSARLLVDSPVKGASVRLDGVPRGHVPSELNVLAGDHMVGLSADGYDDIESRITVSPGERRALSLEPSSSAVYKRWWFWTAIGAAAAGGTVTALMLIEKPGDVGTIAPGRASVSGRPTRAGFGVAFVPVVDLRF